MVNSVLGSLMRGANLSGLLQVGLQVVIETEGPNAISAATAATTLSEKELTDWCHRLEITDPAKISRILAHREDVANGVNSLLHALLDNR